MPDPHDQNPTVPTTPAWPPSDTGDEADARTGCPTFGAPAAAGELGTLGPYRVLKELGKGGMGAVYLATDTRLDRKLALKVMLPGYAADADARERFLREARAAAKISHDNVVTVYEADERGGVPYIAMQFLQGYPLDQFLKTKGTPPLAHAVRIGREAALGLAAAHEMGLIHRDVKPANLWLEAPNGRVKVLDFGLAKPVDAEAELTRSGAIIGTPAYMSPEQARGLKVDHRTDLFSLGAVLYQLCAGRRPFAGPSAMATLLALGTDDPTPVRELNPGVPEPLAQLIHQLLAKKPEHRPQSAAEVAERLHAILERLTSPSPTVALSGADVPRPVPSPVVVPLHITAVPESAFANLGGDGGSDTDATAAESAAGAPARPAGGRGVLIAVGGAVLLAVVAVVAVLSQSGRKSRPPAEPDPSGPIAGPHTDLPPDDTDRKAAEYALSIGGFVRANGEERERKFSADLPVVPFQLTGIEFRDGTRPNDADLAQFKACKHLTRLALISCPRVTDAGLEHFKGCRNLVYLCLDGCRQVGDAGCVRFKDCTKLAHLSLNHTQVTDVGLAHFAGHTNVTNLSLIETRVTDAGVAYFKNCKNLTYLSLRWTGLTGAVFAHLKDKPLTWIDVPDTRVDDAALAHLAGLTGAVRINLSGNRRVTAAGLAHLRGIKGLEHVNVLQTGVTASAVAEFHAAVSGCEVKYDGGTLPPRK